MSNYQGHMKWWTVTNEKSDRRIFSAVTADSAREEARNSTSGLFATGKLTVERMGGYSDRSPRKKRTPEGGTF